MSRMSNIDLTIKEWFKNTLSYIIATLAVLVIAICVYGQADRDIKKAQEKVNRINALEQRLTKQEEYIHQVQADVDNLYKVVE